ncbi:MAG: hypothetical protein LBR77_00015 [Lachnospiraceae bacterium]|nr:hypothetical protein [Lachnospiraceae bacterium]
MSKHIYDLSVMASLPRIQKLLADPEELTAMMAFKRREEKARIGSSLSAKPISVFTIFETMSENEALQDAFTTMQSVYIFDANDRLPFEEIVTALLSIRGFALSEIYG